MTRPTDRHTSNPTAAAAFEHAHTDPEPDWQVPTRDEAERDEREMGWA